MTHYRTSLLSCLAASAFLAACSSTPPAPTASPVETRQPLASAPAPAPAPAATSAGTSQSRVATVDLAAQNAAAAAAAAARSTRVVYFDFDSFVVKDEFKPTIDVFAKVLTTNKVKKMTVEGHTDERGGREYNLALGQKRAEAVVKSLELLGAADQQLEAVSFGEERPADTGHGEDAWAKNRRAELKDK